MKNINEELIKNYRFILKREKIPKENINGLSSIFNFWLELISYLYKKSKKKKIDIRLINSDQNNLFSLILKKEKKFFTENNLVLKKNILLKPYIFFFKFLNSFILWDIFGKKIKFLISYVLFKNFIFLDTKVNFFLKKKFFAKLNKKKYSRNKLIFYKALIPSFFFQKYEPMMKNKIIKTSTINFLSNNYYLNIFFKIEKPIIYGYQHGMGYNFFQNHTYENKFLKYEKKISKKFFHLFPLGDSFGRYNFKKNIKAKPKKIIWVQRKSVSNVERFLLGNYGKLLAEKSFLRVLDKKLSVIRNLYYSLHNEDFLLRPKKCKKYPIMDKLENIINQNDIVLFDSITPTLFHFVLKNKLNFLFIVNKNLNLSILNSKYRRLIKFLMKNKYIFKVNEFNKFKKEMDRIIRSNNYSTNKNKILEKIYV